MSFLATTRGVTGEDVRDLMVAAVQHRFGTVNRLPVTVDGSLTMAAAMSLAILAASLATSALNREPPQSKSTE